MGQRSWKGSLIFLPIFFLLPLNSNAQAIQYITQEQIEKLEYYDELTVSMYQDAEVAKSKIDITNNNEVVLINGDVALNTANLYRRLGRSIHDTFRMDFIDNPYVIKALYIRAIQLYDVACQEYCEAYLQYSLVKDVKNTGISIQYE